MRLDLYIRSRLSRTKVTISVLPEFRFTVIKCPHCGDIENHAAKKLGVSTVICNSTGVGYQVRIVEKAGK